MNIDQICRTCLSDTEPMFLLFDEKEPQTFAGLPLVDILNLCSSAVISVNDSFPNKICATCISEANAAYSFKLKCEMSQKTLYETFAAIKEESVTDTSVIPEVITPLVCIKEEQNEIRFMNDPVNDFTETLIKDEYSSDEDEGDDSIDDSWNARDADGSSEDSKCSSVQQKSNDEETYKCGICFSIHKSIKDVGEHVVANHTKEQLCLICKTEFRDINNLRRHALKHVHQTYTCPLCNKIFKVRQYLRRHLVRHSEDKRFQCTQCLKFFSSRMDLKRHGIVHDTEFKHACEFCDMKFKRKENLVCHRGIHTGELKNNCEECGKSFPSHSKLVIHRRIHSGEKPFVCEICSKGFTKRYGLNTHMGVHKEERPYKCTLCSGAFRQNSNLRAHIKMVHKMEPTGLMEVEQT